MAIAAPFPTAQRTLSAQRSIPKRTAASDLRLTRRGRVVLVSASALFLLVAVLFSGRLSADAGTSLADQGLATGVVVVQQGENLWQIARSIAPQSDPRETVIAIRELNALDDSTVVPGQSLVVPVYRTSAS